jgi:hypothetical protein
MSAGINFLEVKKSSWQLLLTNQLPGSCPEAELNLPKISLFG